MLDVSAAPIDVLLRERRSVRLFRPDPVSRELVDEVLSASLWAPSPHHSQPWRLTVLMRPDDRVRLGRAMAERLTEELGADGMPDAEIARQTGRSQVRIGNAPVVVVCSLVSEGLVAFAEERRSALEWAMAVQSVGALLQSLFLAAHARGVGSCWMAAPMYCPDVVRSTLGLPERFQPQALALLGYPADGGRLRDRKRLEEVVQYL